MEKQIYGNITNTARTQFQFDRIYPNKREMNECKDSDGIYHGRYVLIEYGEDPARNATRLIERNGKFFYYDFPTVQVIPYGTLEDPATIAPGRLCYVVKDNTYIFYETYNNKAQPFKEAYRYNYNPATESINYNTNWSIDKDKYGRGYDSTVWQKVYIDNKEEYIMVAELNTVVPNFTMTLDAPGEIPEAPHLEEESNLNYNLHMPAQWDFRVKQVPENGNSDEKAIQVVKYDKNGNLLSPYKENEISADIFYNKDSFNPFYYDKVNIPEKAEDQVLYAPGKYYYKVYNVWGLRREEQEEDIVDFDGITEFKKEINSSGAGEGKTQFYNESDIENLETVELKKTTEINWSYSEEDPYYRISYRKYALDIENDSPVINRQYYKQTYENSLLIYTPITFTDNEPYKIDTYYYLEEGYIADEETDTFKEDAVYYEKIGEKYQPIDLVYKPEYEKETYYTFCNQYYVKDYSTTRDPKKTYYANIGDTEPVEFTVKYEPGVYYYLKEEGTYEEDPVYVIDLNAEFTPGRIYYNKTIPVLKEGEDKISILPTGQSGRLYNTHIEGQAAEAAKDIQEISINFPSIGRMMFKIWNLVYGKQRRELIYGSPVYDPEMYDNEGNPLYEVGFGELNNLVAIINQVNDLIGHNMIKIANEGSITFNEGNILVDTKNLEYLTVDNAENFIYWIEDENLFYRIKINKIGEKDYSYILIPMNSVGTGIDTVYQTLLEIQKALGTNENEDTASINSLKGALLKLKDIIEEQSKSIEFVEYDESLTMLRTKQWKHIDGTKLTRQWNKKYILATDAVQLYSKYEKYFTKKEFTLYQKTLLSKEEVNENNYLNYFVLSNDGFYQSSKGTSFSNDIDYYNIVILDGTLDGLGKVKEVEIDNILVNVLPYYQAANAEGQLEDYQVDNIFEDVIEYILYDIGHAEPAASINDADNKKYNLLKEENNRSVLSELNVNAKGHVYGKGASYILPQAIVSATTPTNVPIGTLWYDTSTNS